MIKIIKNLKNIRILTKEHWMDKKLKDTIKNHIDNLIDLDVCESHNIQNSSKEKNVITVDDEGDVIFSASK